MLVGAYGEAIGTRTYAGDAVLLRGSSAGLTGSGAKAYSRHTTALPGTAKTGDRFGHAGPTWSARRPESR